MNLMYHLVFDFLLQKKGKTNVLPLLTLRYEHFSIPLKI